MKLETLFNHSKFSEYAAFLKSTNLSTASIDRKLSSLASFQKFLVKKKLIQNPPSSEISESTSLDRAAINPNLISKIFQKIKLSSPVKGRCPQGGGVLKNGFLPKYLAIFTLFAIGVGLGFAIYRQAFTQSKKDLAYSTAAAPVTAGRFLSFQGRLTDSSGNAIQTETGIIFKLYNVGTTGVGTTLYTSESGNSQTVVPDANGIFSVTIGKSHGTTIPSTVFSENAEIWLEITAGGEVMAPRQPIATVAYALNAETLQGLPPSASGLKNTVLVVDGSGDINLGETSPSIISKSGTFGIEGQSVLLTTSAGSGGDIAISPDLRGQLDLSFSGSSPTGGDGFVNAQADANLTSGNLFSGKALVVGSTNYNFINFQNYSAGTTLTNRFSVDGFGNTFVGATLTTTNLAVGSNYLVSNLNSDLLDGHHSSDFVGVGITGSFLYTAGNGLNIATNQFKLGGALTEATRLNIGSTEVMYFSTSGNIGIGTTNPTSALTLGASKNIFLRSGTFRFADTTGYINQLADTGDTTQYDVGNYWNTSTKSFEYRNSYGSINLVPGVSGTPTTGLFIQNTGNVGIGTTVPKYKLEVNGSGLFTTLGVGATDPNYALYTNGKFGVGSTAYFASYVGIGTSSPGTSLDVNGNAAFGTGTRSSVGVVRLPNATSVGWRNSANSGNGLLKLNGNYNFEFSIDSTINAVISMNGNSYFNGGNVGIGTTLPTHKLDIAGDANISTNLSVGGTLTLTQGAGANKVLQSDASGNASWVDSSAIGSTYVAGNGLTLAGGTFKLGGALTENTRLNIGNTEALFIDFATGNIGLGLTNPAYKLQTFGSIAIGASGQFLGLADSAALPSFSWSADANTGMFRAAADTLGFATAAVERFRIKANGNIVVNNAMSVGGNLSAANIDIASLSVGTSATTGSASLFAMGGASAFTNPNGTTYFYDQFKESVTTLLNNHTPDIGTSWGVLIQTGGVTMQANPTEKADLITVANSAVLYAAGSTLPTADYEVSINADIVDTSDDVLVLGARIQDSTNMYLAQFSGTSTYCSIYKDIGGTWTVLATSDEGVVNGNTLKFRVVGSNLTMYKDNKLIASAVDTDITAPGRAGLGGGAVTVASYDADTTWDLDNFKVTGYDGSIRSAYFGDNCASSNCATSLSMVQMTQTNPYSTGPVLGLTSSSVNNNGLSIDIGSSSVSNYGLNITSNNGLIQGLSVRGNGFIGLGTTLPTHKLDVVGDGSFSTNLSVGGTVSLTGTNTTGTGTTAIFIDSTGTLTKRVLGSLAFQDVAIGTTYAAGNGLILSNYQFKLGGALTEATRLNIGSTEVMYFSTAGNVGIGTTNPTEKLTLLNGNVLLNKDYGLYWGDANMSIKANNSNNLITFSNYISSATNQAYKFTNVSLGLDLVTIMGGGNVGIGTTNPLYTLQVGGTGVALIGTKLGVGATGTTAFNVSTDANIGTNLTVGNTLTLTNVTANSLIRTNASNQAIGTSGTVNQILHGDLTWADVTLGTQTVGNYVSTVIGNSQISVTGAAGEGVGVSLSIAGDSIGDAQLAFNTGQHLTTTSTPLFAGLTISAGGIGVSGASTFGNNLTVGGTLTLSSSTAVTAVGNTALFIDPTTNIVTRRVLGDLAFQNNASLGWFAQASANQTIGTGTTLHFDGINGLTTTSVGSSQITFKLGGALTEATRLNIGSTEVMYFGTNGRVGIGTTSPDAKLAIYGGNLSLNYGATDDREWSLIPIYYGTYTPGVYDLEIKYTGGAYGGNVLFTSGNVGIGTSTPLYKLQIAGEMVATKIGIGATSASTFNVVGNGNITTNLAVGYTLSTNDLSVGATIPVADNNIVLTQAAAGGLIQAINTSAWDKNASDDLTTASNLLVIKGDSGTAETINVGNTINFVGGMGLGSTVSATDTITFNIGSSAGISVNADTIGVNAGSGLSFSGTQLILNLGSSNAWTAAQTFLGGAYFGAAGATQGIWNSSGFVGIGTTAPTSLLQLAGSNSIFSIGDTAGNTLFEVTESSITSNLPTNFTSGGDVSMAYDLNFTNSTASYIKSQAPLYIQTESPYANLDLNLTAANAGQIYLNSSVQAIGNLSVGGTVTLTGTNVTGTGTTALFIAPNGTLTQRVLGAGAFTDGIGTTYTASNGLTLTNGNFKLGGALTEATRLNIGSTEVMYLSTSGNVGIGTTNPSDKFQVLGGNISIRNSNPGGNIPSSSGFIKIYGENSSSSYWAGIESYRATYADVLDLRFYTTNSTVGERMRINSIGNVGIGTTNPTTKLVVSDSVQIAGGSNSPSTGSGLELYGGRTSSILAYNRTSPGYIPLNLNASYINFQSSDTDTMRITDGNVGIGTTNPGKLLSLSNAIPEILFTDTDGGDNYSTYLNGGTYVLAYNNTDSRYDLSVNGSGGVGIGAINPNATGLIVNTGNVGIGTTNPGALLQVAGIIQSGVNGVTQGQLTLWSTTASAEGNIYGQTGGGMLLNTNSNAYPIRIDGSKLILGITGNVGIGTSTPLYQLHTTGVALIGTKLGIGATSTAAFNVAGNGNITGNLSIGGTLFVAHDIGVTGNLRVGGTVTLTGTNVTGTGTTALFIDGTGIVTKRALGDLAFQNQSNLNWLLKGDAATASTIGIGATVGILGGNGLTSTISSNNITLAIGSSAGISVNADTIGISIGLTGLSFSGTQLINSGLVDITNASLTRSGSAGSYTVGLNLGNANSWTALQTFTAGIGVSGTANLTNALNVGGTASFSSYVGIGTTAPGYALEVNLGATTATPLNLVSSGKFLRMGALNSTYAHIDTDATSGIYFYDNITTAGTITSGLINSQTISSAANFTGSLNIGTSFNVVGNASIGGTLTLSASTVAASDTTALMINGSNVITKRALGTLAFSSATYDNYGHWDLSSNGVGTTAILSGNAVNFVNGVGISLSQSGSSITINSTGGIGTTYVAGNGLTLATGNIFKLGGALTEATRLNIGSTEVLYLSTSGNIGIGTTNPGSKVQISDTNKTPNGYIYNSNLSIVTTDAAAVDKGGSLLFGGENGQVVTPFGFGLIKGANEAGAAWSGYMSFWTTQSNSGMYERMRINSNGYVGIGTTNPQYKLDVVNSGTEAARFLSGVANADNRIWVGQSSANGRAGALGFTDNSDGTSGFIHLVVYGDNPATGTGLIIKKGGNVGIGTTNPTSKLHVVGNGNITGNLTIGGTFVSVGSTNLVGSLNADLLDGQHSAYFLGVGQTGTLPYVNNATNATLTRAGSGPYTLSLNLGNANTWTADQTFPNINLTGNLSTGSTIRITNAGNLTNIGTYNGYVPSQSATSTNSIYSSDSRNTNFTPQDRAAGLYADFKANATDGLSDGGAYHGSLTFRAYGSSTDLSGGNPMQLSYTENGSLFTRLGIGVTNWGNWRQLATSEMTNNFGFMGSLGIGTTNPTYKLSVAGDGNITTNLTVGGTLSVTGKSSFTAGFDSNAASTITNLTIDGTSGIGLNINNTGITSDISLQYGETIDNDVDGTINFSSSNLAIGGTTVISANRLFFAADGTAGDPSYSFTNNLNSGMYSGGTDILRFATANTDRLTIAANGSVGIGTTAGVSKLTVAGGIDVGYVDGSNLLRLSYDTTNSGSLQSYIGGSAAKLILNPLGGNVGIGNTNPIEKLDVNGNIKASGVVLGTKFLSVGNTLYGLVANNTDPTKNSLSLASTGSIRFNNNDTTGSVSLLPGAASRIQNFDTGLLLAVGTGSTAAGQTITGWDNQLFLKNNGYIGIGTTNPTAHLEIAGASSVISNSSGDITFNSASNNVSFSGDNLININNATIGGTLSTGNIVPNSNLNYDLGSASLRWNNAWIKTLNIGSSTWSFQSPDNSRLSVFNSSTGGTEAFTILSSGNIGMGTTNPGEKLEVNNGNMKITGASNPYLFIKKTNATSRDWYLQAYNDILGLGAGINSGLSITNTGLVGIGTTNPKLLLEVSETIGTTPATSGSTPNGTARFRGENTAIHFGAYPTTGKAWIQANNVNDLSINRDIVINPNGGNIGIGTTAPTQKLTVNGYINIAGGYMLTTAWGIDTLTIKNHSWDGASNNNYGDLAGNHAYFYGGLQSGGSAGTEAGAGQLYVSGTSSLNDSLTVGTAANAYIYMRDDESTSGPKAVHANSNVIGFLSGAGSWLSYWDYTGNQNNTNSVLAPNFQAGGGAVHNSNQFYCPGSGNCHLNYSGSGVTYLGNAAGISATPITTSAITVGSWYIRTGTASGGTGDELLFTNGSSTIAFDTSGRPFGTSWAATWSANASNTWFSDQRLKTNIVDIGTSSSTNTDNFDSLAAINSLAPISFNWNQTYANLVGRTDPGEMTQTQYGLIAQAVEQILPGFVSTDGNGYKSVNYIGMVPLLIRGLQEVDAKVVNLDKDLSITATGQINVGYNVSEDVLKSLGYEGTKNEIEAATYSLTDSLGNVVNRIAQFSEIASAKIKTGFLSATNIVTKNIVAEKIISPKANIDEITATTATISGTLTTDELISRRSTIDDLRSNTATISTLYADNIISKEGSFGDLMTAKVSDLRDEIKKLVETHHDASLPENSTSSAITGTSIMSQSSAWSMNIASDSAKITGDLELNNDLIVGAKLTVNGDTQLGNAFITGTFTTGQIAIKDNLIETTNSALYIQPSNTGSVHIMGDTLVIADTGDVQINGNLKVSGSLIANLITADEIQTNKLTSKEINSDQIKIATDSAQTIIAETGFANIATNSAKLTSNATAGTATLPAGKTEIIITNNKLTANSMVYLTPVGSTKNQVPYIKNKVISTIDDLTSNSSFTIALDNYLDTDIDINWWIIN